MAQLCVKIADGIWIGGAKATADPILLQCNDISAVIRLDKLPPGDTIDVFEYSIPGTELLDMETPSVVKKLETICEDIRDLRDSRRNILIQCVDGRNKSPFVAAYYLIRKCGRDARSTIDSISGVYFTPGQAAAEKLSAERFAKIQNGEDVPAEDPNELAVRASLRALTNRSYRGILLKK
jgi:hypothetical protein